MAVFEEKMPRLGFLLPFLALVFLLSFPFTELGRQELHHEEGMYAALAKEAASFPVKLTAHGETLPHTYPLYPLLVKMLHEKAGLSMESSLRLLPLGLLALLALLVGFSCYSACGGKEGNGLKCGAVGAAMTFATLLPAEKLLEGNPILLSTFLIFAAWVGFFALAQIRNNWFLAWLYTGFLGVFIFWSGGFLALLYLILPMFFLRRPLNIWKKIANGGLAIGGLLILGAILLWLIPRWDGAFHPVGTLPGPGSFPEYVKQVFYMPIDILIQFLPWTFFLYAPFCPALIVIDKNRIFSQFLRVLFWCSLLILTINPFSRSRDIFIIAPLLATLSAMYYPIAARRYGFALNKLLLYLGILLSGTAAAVFVLRILPEKLWKALPGLSNISWAARSNGEDIPFFLLAFAILPALGAVIACCRKKSLWITILLLFTSSMMLFWGALAPQKRIAMSRMEAGRAIQEGIGPVYEKGMPLYKDLLISGLYAECFYSGARVRQLAVDTPGKLPAEKEIYLLTVRAIQPPDSSRLWTRLSVIPYKNQKLYIWKGTQNVRKFTEEEEFIRNMRF